MPIFIGLNASDAGRVRRVRAADAAANLYAAAMSRALSALARGRARAQLARRVKNLGARPNFFLHRSQLRLFIVFATHSHVPMAHRGYATT
jgi:hypothetical protein